MSIPTLMTERLTLRPYTGDDFKIYADFLAGDGAKYMDGPHDQMIAWSWFTNDIAHWHLFGYGNLVITDRMEGTVYGFTGVTQGPLFPEPELGWFLLPTAQGQGYGTEAAGALLAHIFANSELKTVVSYIDHAHAPSIALATRIGAVLDENAETPQGDLCAVYRHHPQTEAVQ